MTSYSAREGERGRRGRADEPVDALQQGFVSLRRRVDARVLRASRVWSPSLHRATLRPVQAQSSSTVVATALPLESQALEQVPQIAQEPLCDLVQNALHEASCVALRQPGSRREMFSRTLGSAMKPALLESRSQAAPLQSSLCCSTGNVEADVTAAARLEESDEASEPRVRKGAGRRFHPHGVPGLHKPPEGDPKRERLVERRPPPNARDEAVHPAGHAGEQDYESEHEEHACKSTTLEVWGARVRACESVKTRTHNSTLKRSGQVAKLVAARLR